MPVMSVIVENGKGKSAEKMIKKPPYLCKVAR